MIKKSTLIFLFCAIVLCGVFAYLEIKKGLGSQPVATGDNSRLVFSIPESDIGSVTLTHPRQPDEPAIHLEKNKDTWRIVQPLAATADQTAVQSVLDDLTTTKASPSTEPTAPDRLKIYGLTPPQVQVAFRLKNGARHTLEIGDKDFTGNSVYAIVDGAKTVSLLPQSVVTAPNDSLDALRDHTVLPLTTYQVASFTLKNPSGEMSLKKSGDQWNFTKPSDTLADPDAVAALLAAVSNARLVTFASEKPDTLPQYGLTNPAIDFTFADDTGKKSTLLLGKKYGTGYFARNLSRPDVFVVDADLYAQLAKNYGDLRDKKVLHFDSSNITGVEFHNDHGMIAVRGTGQDNWVVDAPAQQKGKSASSFKVFRTLVALRADRVIDHPQAALVAQLAKPAIEVVLTDKNGKKLTLKMSKPSGQIVYAQTSDSPSLWVVKKQDFDDLNFPASDILE